MKILIAEDDPVGARLLERTLTRAGYAVVCTTNGVEALAALQRERFDALLTDWMMPRMDGIELTIKTRERVRPAPAIIMVTAIDSATSKEQALGAGADDYIAKPYQTEDVLRRLSDCLARARQPGPPQAVIPPPGAPSVSSAAEFPAVCLAASTGGPNALIEIFRGFPRPCPAAFLVVMHAPAWMMEALASRLTTLTSMPVRLAQENHRVEPGEVILGVSGSHLTLDTRTREVRLLDTAPENHARPAADPLFRSAALAFGPLAVGVVLTGIGCDGAAGAQHIVAAGGQIIVQEPSTAVAASMPQGVLDLGIAHRVAPLEGMARCIEEAVKAERVPARV